ncbi:MAG: hypothetical protein AAFZ87_02070 [Planctomycetota bacterium]
MDDSNEKQEWAEHGARLRALAPAPLAPAEVERLLNAAMPAEHGGGASARVIRRWPILVSHAAAAIVGWLLAFGWSSSSAETSEVWTASAVREVRVEVPVEVPVEVVIEKRVEVPVEVRVETPIERIVEVDRPVPHPLQARLDEQLRLARALASLSAAAAETWRDGLVALRPLPANPQPSIAQAEPSRAEKAAPPRESRAPQRAERPAHGVAIVRGGGGVTLKTSGALGQVVPALIGALEDGDDEVVAAATNRLVGIRRGLGERAVPLVAEEFGKFEERTRPGGIRSLLSRDERRPGARNLPLEPSDLWRDWWSRQRATGGAYVASATL